MPIDSKSAPPVIVPWKRGEQVVAAVDMAEPGWAVLAGSMGWVRASTDMGIEVQFNVSGRVVIRICKASEIARPPVQK